MKKQCLNGCLALSFVLVFVLSEFPTLGSRSIKQTQQEQLTDALKKACRCSAPASPPRIRTVIAPELDPTIVPIDARTGANSGCFLRESECQSCFNCFAWQLFIALNWPAASKGEPDRTASFGNPDNCAPVVWETFKTVDDIFKDPNIEKLPAWEQGDSPRVMSAMLNKRGLATQQADRHWLTDRFGKMVWYEIRVNKDEYQYIAGKDLYNQEGIYRAFAERDGIRLPDQPSIYGQYGAIEIKAAFRLVPKDSLDEYKTRYKISYAKNQSSGDIVPMALVGLHIIKKTPNSPQFVWATFEHQDNCPDETEVAQVREWSFYDRNKDRNWVPNWANPPKKPMATNVPVQVKRIKPIREESKEINKAVHNLIRERLPNSVWLNYVLVDVQWPISHRVKPPFNESHILPHGEPRPASVANTTMETYMQTEGRGGHGILDKDPEGGPSSCIGCHRLAARTPFFGGTIPKIVRYTDYSTIFLRAKAKDPAAASR